MEDSQQYSHQVQPTRTAPYAVASLVLGVSSLLFSGLGVTLILGIIGLIYSNKGFREYRKNPSAYTGEGMLEAGKVTSIVGIVLASLALVAIVFWVLVLLGVLGVALAAAS